MNKPQIRIKGFSGDEWVEKKLKDLCDKDSSCLTQGKLGESSGCYPVFGASGFVQNISKYSKDKDYIGIIKDGAGAGRVDIYPAFSSLLGTMQYILPNDNSEIYFLCNLLNNTDFSLYLTGSTIPHIYFKDYCEEVVYIPVDKKEQIYISAFFRSLDSLIQSAAKKIASLKQIKAASLQSMFPQNGETKPKVRFKGFEEEWEICKLSDIARRVTRKNTNLESKLPLTISSIDGLVSQINYFNNIVASSNLRGYYLIKNGEFAYNKSYSNGYPWGSVKRLDRYENGALSTLYIVFEIKGNISSDYLTHFFDTSLWHKDVSERAAEGARNHGLLNISADDFLDIQIIYPNNISEQQKIASYFRSLDNQISLQEKRLEKLKQIKSTCLDKMFV